MISVTLYLQLTVYDDLCPSKATVKLSDGLDGAWYLLVFALWIVLDAFLDETSRVLRTDHFQTHEDCFF